MKFRITPPGWLAIYALTIPLGLGLIALWEPLRSLEDGAAWVQAIGSIAAIVGAIFIDQGSARRAEEQRAAELREQRRDRASAVWMVQSALINSGRYTRAIREQLAERPETRISMIAVQRVRQELRKADLVITAYVKVPAGDAEVMRAISTASVEVSAVIEAFDRAIVGIDEINELDDRVHEAIEGVANVLLGSD